MGNDLAVTTHPTGSNLCVGNAEYPKRYVIAIQYFSAEIPLHLIIEQADSHIADGRMTANMHNPF